MRAHDQVTEIRLSDLGFLLGIFDRPDLWRAALLGPLHGALQWLIVQGAGCGRRQRFYETGCRFAGTRRLRNFSIREINESGIRIARATIQENPHGKQTRRQYQSMTK